MTGQVELERAIASVDATTAHLEALLADMLGALAEQRSAVQRLRTQLVAERSPIEAEEILQAVALDDELMADLDALVEMDTARLAAGVRERPRDGTDDLDGLADRAVLRTWQAVLAEMERRGVVEARAIVPGRGDVYRYLVAAAEQLAAADRAVPAGAGEGSPPAPAPDDLERDTVAGGLVR